MYVFFFSVSRGKFPGSKLPNRLVASLPVRPASNSLTRERSMSMTKLDQAVQTLPSLSRAGSFVVGGLASSETGRIRFRRARFQTQEWPDLVIPKKGLICISPANQFMNSPFFCIQKFGVLSCGKKQTNPQRIGGPHGAYKPVPGRDVNWPCFGRMSLEVGPLLPNTENTELSESLGSHRVQSSGGRAQGVLLAYYCVLMRTHRVVWISPSLAQNSVSSLFRASRTLKRTQIIGVPRSELPGSQNGGTKGEVKRGKGVGEGTGPVGE